MDYGNTLNITLNLELNQFNRENNYFVKISYFHIEKVFKYDKFFVIENNIINNVLKFSLENS